MGERSKGVILGYVNVAAQVVVTFTYIPILLSIIGQEEYGLYQLAGSIAAYMNIIESMLTSSALRFYCECKARNDMRAMENTLGLARFLYRCASGIVIVAGIACIAAFRTIYGSTLSEGEIAEGSLLLACLAATIVLNMLNYTISVVNSAFERFTFSRIMDLLLLVSQPILVLLVVHEFPYAIVIVGAQFVLTAAAWIAKRVYVKKTIGVVAKIHLFEWCELKPMLTFSVAITIGMIADVIFAKTDQLIIGAVLGTVPVAIYSIGYQIYACYNSLGIVVSSVFMPKLSRLAKQDNALELMTSEWIKTGRIASYVVAGIITGFCLYGREFIRLWVGDGYESAYYVAVLLMLAFSIELIQRVGLTILQVLNKYTFRAIVYVACAVTNVPLTMLFIQHWGIVGAAASSAAVLFTGSGLVMNIYYAKSIGLNVSLFWRQIGNALRGLPAIVLLGVAIGRITLQSQPLTFFAHVVLFVLAFIAVLHRTMSPEEKNLIDRFVPKMRGKK